MSTFVQYDENNLAHQEPVQAISEWQQWNDVTGEWAMAFEDDLLEIEREEKKQAIHEAGWSLSDLNV